jgi:hypothetical protein
VSLLMHEIRQVRVESACNMSLSLAKRGLFQGISSPCIPATEAHRKTSGEHYYETNRLSALMGSRA